MRYSVTYRLNCVENCVAWNSLVLLFSVSQIVGFVELYNVR
jgi:hypothetical protein